MRRMLSAKKLNVPFSPSLKLDFLDLCFQILMLVFENQHHYRIKLQHITRRLRPNGNFFVGFFITFGPFKTVKKL
jgi:hypothetical protein